MRTIARAEREIEPHTEMVERILIDRWEIADE